MPGISTYAPCAYCIEGMHEAAFAGSAPLASLPSQGGSMTRMFIFAAMMAVSFSAHASTVTLTATPGAASANLTWTVTNGAVNAQEVYRDTDSNPAGACASPPSAPVQRSYSATGLTNGVTYYFWIKARQSSDNVWVNSNAASAVPCRARAAPPITGRSPAISARTIPRSSMRTARGGSSRPASASTARCRATAACSGIRCRRCCRMA